MGHGFKNLCRRMLLGVVLVVASWYAMQAVHEFGHVLHAWISNGQVQRVSMPLIGFSQTHLDRNPHPQFVAWGGAIWGCMIPIVFHAVIPRRAGSARAIAAFFAGFCLVANGAYLAVGSIENVGDAGDLVRGGAPRISLIAFGVVAIPLGLWYWHQIGRGRVSESRPPAGKS